MATTTFHGNCHCGRYRFEISAPEIKDVISCTCSLCAKKGYLWLILPPSAFKVVRDTHCLTKYQSSTVEDEFCNYCGTGVVGKHLTGPLRGQFAVNVRAIREVNPFLLESSTKTIKTEDKRVTLPIPDTCTSEAVHIGSCHCRKVRAEMLVSLKGQDIKEDNCSSCVRTAYIGVYPSRNQVRIQGKENTFEYLYGRKFVGSTFCSTCGVHVYSNMYGPPLSVFDKVPRERRQHVMAVYRKNMDMQPLNIRAFEGVNLELLQIKRSDEGTEGYELNT